MPDPSDCGRLLRIEGFADLWADACLQNDEGDLAFLSFYGRDASAIALPSSPKTIARVLVVP